MTRNIIWWLILVFQFLILVILIKGLPLNEFISHYEGVNYDRTKLNDARHRAKRSLLQTISLDLHAFGRPLQLRLRPDSTIFSESPVIETSNGVWDYDQSNIYKGHLQDQANSKIHGTLTIDGHFEGKILTVNETFILEPSSRYFINKPDFHTVIYKASHVNVAKFKNTNIDKLRDVLKKRSRVHRHIQNHYTRQRRSTVKNTCELYIKADYDFYEKYGGFSTDFVINQIVQYVQTVNNIFSVIDFDKDGSADNIKFVIKRIKVYTNITDSNYVRYIGNFDVAKYLEIHSEENYDQFCLSYILTHRDFGDGVLGLAWTASLDENAAGGVCEKYLEINGVYRSLNTGFVTTLNYGQTVPNIVCHLTLAHEIGHNMGSEHDPENITCTPGGSSGNYLMYPKATSGEESNNLKFSPCSISQMGPIIQARGSSSVGCFIDSSQSICGNKVVEPGEECDCGWEDECTETCCNPQYSNNNIPATPCTLKPNATCSPSQGSCCSPSCQLITLSDNYVCQQNTSCQMKSVCTDDNNATCPAPQNLPNKTICEGSKVCLDGECSGSICLAYDYQPCQCKPTVPGDWNDELLCAVCCTIGGICKSSYETDTIPNMTMVSGSPCNDNQGYCDVFNKCREVDPSGFLNELANWLNLSGKEIEQWLKTYWWAAALIVFGLLLLLALCVKCCNKKQPPPNSRVVRPSRNPQQFQFEEKIANSNRQQPHHRQNFSNKVAPMSTSQGHQRF